MVDMGREIVEVLGLDPEAKLNTTSSSGTGSHLIGIYYPLVLVTLCGTMRNTEIGIVCSIIDPRVTLIATNLQVPGEDTRHVQGQLIGESTYVHRWTGQRQF